MSNATSVIIYLAVVMLLAGCSTELDDPDMHIVLAEIQNDSDTSVFIGYCLDQSCSERSMSVTEVPSGGSLETDVRDYEPGALGVEDADSNELLGCIDYDFSGENTKVINRFYVSQISECGIND